MTNEPTDAELLDCARGKSGHVDFARAVLTRWGQPAHSGEPVAWLHDCAALLTNDVELWIDACPHCGKPRNAPQPVEREPLPSVEIMRIILEVERQHNVLRGTTNWAAAVGRAIEAAHGIGETP